VDDFGIAPIEAMMYGVPVIGIKDGGAVEIIEEGKTGEFFTTSTAEIIADGVRRFIEKEEKYDREYIKQSVEKFSKEKFIREMREFISRVINNFQ